MGNIAAPIIGLIAKLLMPGQDPGLNKEGETDRKPTKLATSAIIIAEDK